MTTLFTHARIWTGDPALPEATSMVVDQSRVVHVGEVAEWNGAVDEEVDLSGCTVVPGLVDAHTHPEAVAGSGWHVRLPWTHDLDQLLGFVRDFASAHPPEEHPFLYFEYYPSDLFAHTDRAPTAALLDTAVDDRPVLCQDFSEHAAWVNTRMLDLMQVSAATPDPVPGLESFARDSSGVPTGEVFEGAHRHFMEAVYAAVGWHPPESPSADMLRPFFDFLSARGVVAVFEACLSNESTLGAVRELAENGLLNLHYEAAPRFRSLDELPQVLDRVRDYQLRYGSDLVHVRTVKLFLDGTNETGTSALLAPSRPPDPPGADGGGSGLQMGPEELSGCLRLCNEAGVDLHIHLVGDRAFRVACDAVAAARAQVADTGEQWAIQVVFAHCELIDPDDMDRPAQLGIIVNWTTHWSGGYFGEEAKAHVGEDRWDRMYAFNRILDSGAVVSFSSDVVTDYELHRADPWFGMQVAMTRVDPEFPLDGTRYPGGVRPDAGSVIAFERLLAGYTAGGATQLRLTDQLGSIAPGKAASFVVLDSDPFATPPTRLQDTEVRAVMFAGRVVSGALPPRHARAPQTRQPTSPTDGPATLRSSVDTHPHTATHWETP